ncbi:MAG: hypothetical protein HKN24_03685 [Acidimicrobiales bacterium]|nr:hypothetical protein [Acidimicrobiales bacterium]
MTDRLSGLANVALREQPSVAQTQRCLERARAAQRLLDGCVAALGVVAGAAEADGSGRVVEEVLSGGGVVARSTVTADAGRVRVMQRFEQVAAAIRTGSALPANVDCLAGTMLKITAAEGDALVGNDTELAERISHLKPESFRKYVQRCVDRIRKDHGRDAAERERRASSAHVAPRRDRSGYRLVFDAETERGTAVFNAVRNERRELARRLGDHDLTREQLTVQAVHDLIVRGSAVDAEQYSSRPTVVVNVLSDRDTLTHGPHDHSISETFDGQHLSPFGVGRLCCDAVLRRLDTAADINIGVARASRTATAEQRAALRTLYPTCPLSGAVWSSIEVHHIVEWDDGGETKLSNLVPISSYWHHKIHDAGWRLEMESDRSLRLYRPDGTLHRTVDPPTPITSSHVLAA